MKLTLPAEVTRSDLAIVKRWVDAGEHARAGVALSNYLADGNDDIDAWYLMGEVLLAQDNPAIAALIYEWTTAHGADGVWQHWCNWARALETANRYEEAEEKYRHALSMDPQNPHILTALGTNMVAQYRSEEAIELCKQALALDARKQMARSTMGFAYIQQRDYARGWDCYEAGYGKLRFRKERAYAPKEPRWDGSKGKHVRIIVHGEQGIGDQIAGLEPLSDLRKAASVVALEVDAKLAGLVARSYPGLEVHGTLKEKDLEWPLRHVGEGTVHSGLFSVHRHFRRSEDDYPGKPYLTADPLRRLQWRALLAELGPEPKVGIAWTGGISMTQRTARRADLSQWLPILRQPCHWISLEYRDRTDEIERFRRQRGIVVHDYPWATRTDDYDDTAALVAELDLVVCVPTTIVHTAGALGVPACCMVHRRPNLHYTGQGKTIPYYGNTVRLFRRAQGHVWDPVVAEVATFVEDMLNARSATAA